MRSRVRMARSRPFPALDPGSTTLARIPPAKNRALLPDAGHSIEPKVTRSSCRAESAHLPATAREGRCRPALPCPVPGEARPNAMPVTRHDSRHCHVPIRDPSPDVGVNAPFAVITTPALQVRQRCSRVESSRHSRKCTFRRNIRDLLGKPTMFQLPGLWSRLRTDRDGPHAQAI